MKILIWKSCSEYLYICSHEKMNIEIHGIMESLYQKMINEESYDEEEE